MQIEQYINAMGPGQAGPRGDNIFRCLGGGWGCGAYCLPHWFSLPWTPELESASIQVKELVPVVIAAALFRKEWTGKVVLFKVDNMAVVDIIANIYSQEPHLIQLVLTAQFLVYIRAHTRVKE